MNTVTVALAVALVAVVLVLALQGWHHRPSVTRRGDQAAEMRLAQATATLVHDQDVLTTDREQLRSDRGELLQQRTDLADRERRLIRQTRQLDDREAELKTGQAELVRAEQSCAERRQQELERIAGLTAREAKAQLVVQQEEEARRDAAVVVRRIETDARSTAEQRARAILADSMQRLASDQTAQSVTSVIHLASDDIKGRIIGREGRNIRAFESVTGVNVIIDDTPEAVVLSCFDPVRREVGRVAMQALIDDGRIHPNRIEEAYERAGQQIEDLCWRAAEDAVLQAGVGDVPPELMKLLGQLKYRTSYGQNVLAHLIETCHLARGMADELGIDSAVAARGAFLHDIGKALTHEAHGSHAIIGADLARRYGESDSVVHCIEAHHDEVPPSTIAAVLTQAADACSGSRPGARRESLESYVQRLENIEAIAQAKDGVAKAYAMQAGRELRVMVRPDVVDDIGVHVMAREVAKQIEQDLTYPGQIRVTVIRESRSSEVAR